MALAGKVGERSDLYATVDVQLPRQVTAEQRDHFEALAKTGVVTGIRLGEVGQVGSGWSDGHMNLNKFTEKAQEAVVGAQQLAESLNHPQIEPEHLLVTLVEQDNGVVPALLRKLQLDPAAIAARGADGRRQAAAGARRIAGDHFAAAASWSPTWRRPKPAG